MKSMPHCHGTDNALDWIRRELRQGDWFSSADGFCARFVGFTPTGSLRVVYRDRHTDASFALACETLRKQEKRRSRRRHVKLAVAPIHLKEAKQFVGKEHRHNKAPQGHRASIAAVDESGKIRGVAVVGRPVSRILQQGDPGLAEITRLCTDGTPNACSFLLGAAWRLAKGLGYTKLQTYTLASESGSSLKAANFQVEHVQERASSWDSPSRRRSTKQKADGEKKIRWSITTRKK